ncbi:MAG: ACP S-malonyltransferase [Kiloniellales bacterium]|nr:ACP S-malonyltransferase [Kiloniellales bacterium]MDJ0968962.1 ACP S-malonyltransferase [Kiloniellales bacterium]
MARAFIFPGQGSQAVGMGQELAEASTVARHLFQEVDDALSQHLTRLMFEGPEDELRLTENAQPALMAVSLAVVRVLEQEAGIDLAEAGELVAGHSLGEYSALAAVGAFEVAEAARLLKRRGQAMQAAVPVGEGAMAALLGLDLEAAAAVAEEAAQGEVCAPANDNAPGQVVVSGHKTAVERALEVAAERGARKSVLLPVSAPFHCALMAPAAEEMAEALGQTPPREPRLPLVSNVSAAAITDPEAIRDLLVQQVTDMVRWRESVLFIKAQGVDTLVELGAGKVLTGLTRRIDRELTGLAVGGPGDVETLQKLL